MRKSRIVFLPVPDSLDSLNEELNAFTRRQGEEEHAGNFTVDPSIPLPVELPEGDQSPAELAEKLSWEMILSGMIRVISSGHDEMKPGWADYYRAFVLALKPEIYNEFTGAAIVKAQNGDFDMALEITGALEALCAPAPAPGVALNKALFLEGKAEALEQNGHADEAERVYSQAWETYENVLSLKPLLPDALFNSGFFFMRRRDYARARECFSEYAILSDDSEKREKALALALEIKDRALDDTSFSEALDFIRRGEDGKALESIRDFLERHPKVWNGWFVLGWALRKLCRWKDGLEALRKAVELREMSGRSGGAAAGAGVSNIAELRNETAICLMELGDLPAARKELETALREDPENVTIVSNLGVLAEKAGDHDSAAAFFRTVLDLAPDDPLAKAYFGKL
jgi:tetratricopeptide (TPR) repeat protein